MPLYTFHWQQEQSPLKCRKVELTTHNSHKLISYVNWPVSRLTFDVWDQTFLSLLHYNCSVTVGGTIGYLVTNLAFKYKLWNLVLWYKILWLFFLSSPFSLFRVSLCRCLCCHHKTTRETRRVCVCLWERERENSMKCDTNCEMTRVTVLAVSRYNLFIARRGRLASASVTGEKCVCVSLFLFLFVSKCHQCCIRCFVSSADVPVFPFHGWLKVCLCI